MNCQNCGANVDGKAFCAQCGAPVGQPAPVQAPYNAIPQQQTLGNPTKVLVFGIIGLALSGFGIIGLIFSIIGLVQANKYIAQYGNVANQVRIGRRLAIAGLIISIIMTVFWIFMIIIVAVAAASSQGTWTVRSNGYTYRINY